MEPAPDDDVIDVIEEHEEVFETIVEEAEDPVIAQRYGQQPLDLLELHRERS